MAGPPPGDTLADAGAPPPARGSRRWAWAATWLVLAVGIGATVAVLADLGTARLHAMLAGAWPAVAAGVALELAAVLLRARALGVLLRPDDRAISRSRLVIAQAAGGAMGELLPGGVAGDTTRLAVLATHLPTPPALAAIVAYDLAAVAAEMVLVVGGSVATAAIGGLPTTLALALWGAAAMGAVVLVTATWAIRRGLARTTLAALARTGAISPARRVSWSSRVADVDRALRERQARPPAEALQAGALVAAARGLGLLELALVVRALGLTPDAGQLAGILLGGVAVSRVAGLLPMGLGARDVGTAGLFAAVGLPAASGAAAVLVIRARQLVTTALALLALAAVQSADRPGRAAATPT